MNIVKTFPPRLTTFRILQNEREREIKRRASGKEAVEAQKKWKEDQMKRDQALKRKEKEEDRKAKAAIKEKIERDKREREARLGRAKPAPQPTTTSTTPTPQAQGRH